MMVITSTQFSSHKPRLQDVINVSSSIQNQLTKNLKNHRDENLIPFPHWILGSLILRVKGYFMHGWSDSSDVKLTASVVYLGTMLFLFSCYSILAVMKWDLHRFS